MDPQREGALGNTYDLALLRRLWHYVRPYRTRFILALVCLPLTSACVLAQPYLLKLAVDRYMAAHDAEGLAVVGLLFAGVLVGEFIFFYTQFHATMLMAQNSLADLRRALFAHLQELPASFFERTPVGRLVTRLTTDVDAINEAFSAGTLTLFMADGLIRLRHSHEKAPPQAHRRKDPGRMVSPADTHPAPPADGARAGRRGFPKERGYGNEP